MSRPFIRSSADSPETGTLFGGQTSKRSPFFWVSLAELQLTRKSAMSRRVTCR